MGTMPRKKKQQKKFRAIEAVKELARQRIGAPKPSRVVANGKKKREEKHKPTLDRLLEDQ